MPKERLPSQVSLPDVPHYTENIIFGGLGLPIGFDQERLLVNVKQFERFRRVAGLDRISIVSGPDETEPGDPGVSSIDSQGTATMGLAAKRTNRPLSASSLQFKTPHLTMYGRPDTTIKINSAEIEARIENNSKYKKGAFDITGRAKFLNKAVKRGLAEANFDASFDGIKTCITCGNNAMNVGLSELGMIPLAMVPALGLVNNFIYAGLSARKSSGPEGIRQTLTQHRYSLVYGITPDRYAAAQGLLTAKRLIKAQK